MYEVWVPDSDIPVVDGFATLKEAIDFIIEDDDNDDLFDNNRSDAYVVETVRRTVWAR